MKTAVLSCEVFHAELALLLSGMHNPPDVKFLDLELHRYPEMLRSKFQEAVDGFESESEGPLTVLCCYGLCGRALTGVHASRAILVFPRTHDCIPLLLGVGQKEVSGVTSDGAVYWLAPGWLADDTPITRHLEEDERFCIYEQKYGSTRARRVIELEKAYMKDYSQACHIRWPEMGDAYVTEARRVAQCVRLPYSEAAGSSGYLAELLLGGNDPEKFLHLQPGQTIDMNVDGAVCPVFWNNP